MRNLVVYNFMSLDGFFEGANKSLDWFLPDEELVPYIMKLLHTSDTLILGRVTYQQMAAFWPDEKAHDPFITDWMNTMPKVVFSRTLEHVEWNNSRLVKEDITAEIAALKKQPGKDLLVLGSGTIVSVLAEAELIDEFWLIVHPVLLGRGTPLIQSLKDRVWLKLTDVKAFGNGNVSLRYLVRSHTAV